MSTDQESPKERSGQEKLQKEAKPKGEVDPFWLDRVFPDPTAVFAFDSPTPAELTANCVFALDANVLLAPYEVGPESFQDIEQIYKTLATKCRLFVPAQAVREYGKNRAKKISEVYQAVHDRLSKLPPAEGLKCPILEGMTEYEKVKSAIDELRQKSGELKESLTALKEALPHWGWTDKVSSLYRELFNKERIIDHGEKRETLLADLAFRTTHQTPPSYKDAGKLDGGIGDLLIWHSLLALGKRQRRNVVFVSNDEKNDWSVRVNKEALLPPELTLEFHRVTGQKLGIFNWTRFLKSMNAQAKTLQEAKVAEIRCNPIVIRVALLLQGIADIVSDYLEYHDSYSEEERHEHMELSAFSDFLRELREIKDDIALKAMHSQMIRTLHRMTGLLESIAEDLGTVSYDLIRMKRAIGPTQERMKSKMEAFLALHEEYASWMQIA